MKDQHRLPIASYEQAIWRLAMHIDNSLSGNAFHESAVQMVADIFWVRSERVWKDVRRYQGSL